MKTLNFSLPKFPAFPNLWQSLTQIISRCAEIRVWQKSDRQGNLYWHGYDPSSGDSVSFGSETEIRMWIEQHYYR